MKARKLPSISPDDTPEVVALKQDAINKEQAAHDARHAAQSGRGTAIYPDLQKESKNAARRAREALRKLEALTDPEVASTLEEQRRIKNEARNQRRKTIKEKAATDPEAFLALQKEKEQKERSRKKAQRKKKASNYKKKQHRDRQDELKLLENSNSLSDISAILDAECEKLAWRNERHWYNIRTRERAKKAPKELKN